MLNSSRSLKYTCEERKGKAILKPLRLARRYLLVLIAVLVIASLFLIPDAHANESAFVWTDKEDYNPDETVTIFGSGFLANANVTIMLLAPNLNNDTIYALTDGFGNFTAQYVLDGMEGTYTVTATDGTNTATTTFTEAWRYFTATISPTTATTGETKSYTITITNDPSSTSYAKLGSAKIKVPSGFTSVSIISVSYPSGKTWTATLVSGEIKLQATADSYRLNRGESVSVTFSATAPGTEGTYTWTTSAWTDRSWGSGYGKFTIKGSQPTVTVTAYRYFTATISPTTCLTGETKTYTITITNDMSSSLGVTLGSVIITIPQGPPGFTAVTIISWSPPSGKTWTASVVSGKINLTAQSSSDQLSRGESVSVTFDATAPGTTGTYEWTTEAYDCIPPAKKFTIIDSQPTVTVTAALHPAIDVSKSGPSYAHENDTITYTITVSNTGDCQLHNVSVTDTLLGPIYSNGLAYGETKTFTKTYKVPSPSGDISNTVTAVGSDALSRQVSDSASWFVDVLHPGIDVSKSGPAYAHKGDTITYTVTVSNPSTDTTMTKVSVIDSLLGDISGSFSASLAPLASETKTFTYNVPSPSGDITNTVTVKYKDALNTEKTDSASWTVDVLHPGIDVSKSGPAYAHEGDTITYTITVSNTGDCKLFGVSVTDTLLGSIWTGDLDAGATKTFTKTYTIPSPSGDISNTVTASGSDALGRHVSDSASWTVKVVVPPVCGVGGVIISMNKVESPTPWIVLISTILSAVILMAVITKRRGKKAL